MTEDQAKVILIDPRAALSGAPNAAKWGEIAEESLLRMNVTFEHIIGEKVTRQNVEQLLRKRPEGPEVVAYYGFGRLDCLYGARNERIIDRLNVSMLSNRVVFACACKSANVLGHLAVDSGAKGYLGFQDNVWSVVSEPFAEAAGRAIFSGVRSLVDNADVLTAHKVVRTALESLLSKVTLEGRRDAWLEIICLRKLSDSLLPILARSVPRGEMRYRAAVPARVILRGRSAEIAGQLIDISENGACIQLEGVEAPALPEQVGCEVLVSFRDRVDAPLAVRPGDEVRAWILRSWNQPQPGAKGDTGIAVRFDRRLNRAMLGSRTSSDQRDG